VHVGVQYWRKLGVDEILATIGFSERARILTLAMTMNRLIHPCSEHAMPDWIRRTALADILAVDFDRLRDEALYRQLDRLHPKRAAIEAALAERERTLFNCDNTVLLYDLTSTYFEGQARRIAKARRGYSRDHRPDCKQVVVGLVLNGEGFPLAHEIFAGNVQDRASLPAMLDQLNARVPLKPGQTVVVDRGIAYDENLAEIGSRQLHYLVAARQPERDCWLAEFEGEGFEEVIRPPSPRNPSAQQGRAYVVAHRAPNPRDPSGLHRGAANRSRCGAAHPQGLHPRARPPPTLRTTQCATGGHAATTELERSRRRAGNVVTEKCPNLLIYRRSHSLRD